jgi:two-component system chemotaxis response regulator CheB
LLYAEPTNPSGETALPPPEPAKKPGGGRDVIVIGGVDALRLLLERLPADLPASVFIVLHTADEGPSLLADVLGRTSSLPVLIAEEAQSFAPGLVYLAPPDRHLLVGADHVHTRRGPRENGTRPAIDPLFRSAAANCSTRVIGVILTGLLDDGTAGLQAIKRCGGLAVVQDPSEAAYAQMPRSAIRDVAVDHVLSLEEIAAALPRLAGDGRPPAPEVPRDIWIEAVISAQEFGNMHYTDEENALSPITCPECHGSLREIRDRDLVRFRCHTGHGFTLEALGVAQGQEWERALYGALRAQQERAEVVARLADQATLRGAAKSAEQLRRRARDYEEGADLLQRLISYGNGGSGEDRES